MVSKNFRVENSVQDCHVPFAQFTLIYRDSLELVWQLAQGPGTGRKRQMEHNFLLDIPIGNFRVPLKMFLTIYS